MVHINVWDRFDGTPYRLRFYVKDYEASYISVFVLLYKLDKSKFKKDDDFFIDSERRISNMYRISCNSHWRSTYEYL